MIRIVSDSTLDLSEELLRRYDIDVIPLHVVLGEKSYQDGREISPDEIYTWAESHKDAPKTSACTPEQACKAFEKHLKEGHEIIAFSISSHMSSTCQAMHIAASQLHAEDKISIIDSANLSTGNALLSIAAAEMAKAGKSRAEIVKEIEYLKPRVHASFVVDTLSYLHRGGRCSGASALLGSTLKIHPQIQVAGGKMSPGQKYRGKMGKVIREYVENQKSLLLSARKEHVFITHSGCEESILASVKEQLSALQHFDEIHVTRAGGVVSCHCGPGTLGVLYIAENAVE